MVFKARKGKKAARKPRRTARPSRGVRTVAEVASLTESRSFALLNTNQMYQVYNLQLINFLRASLVAKAYQYYRIKNCKMVLSPLRDTFASTTGDTIPYLYYMIDRTKNLVAATTPQQLKIMGAKPHRIDDKIVSFQWRPSVLNAVYDSVPPAGQSTTSFVQYKVSPWLNCRDSEVLSTWQADSTDHQGMVYILDNAGGANVPVKLEMIVEFEFKKPSYTVGIAENGPEPVDVNDLIQEFYPTVALKEEVPPA